MSAHVLGSASEVTTLWRYTNLFIIYYYYYHNTPLRCGSEQTCASVLVNARTDEVLPVDIDARAVVSE